MLLVYCLDYKDVVVWDLLRGEYQLEGILSLPKGVDRPSVAIIVPGSGYADADGGRAEGEQQYHQLQRAPAHTGSHGDGAGRAAL